MVRGVGLVLGACRPRGVSVRVCRRVPTGGLPGSAPAVPRPSVPRPSSRSEGGSVVPAGRPSPVASLSASLSARPPARPAPGTAGASRLFPMPRPGSRGGGGGQGKEEGEKGVCRGGGGVGGGSGASVVGPARRSRCSLVRRGASARARTGAGPLVRGGSRPLSPPVRASRSSPFALASRPCTARSVPRGPAAHPRPYPPSLPPSRSLSLSPASRRVSASLALLTWLILPVAYACLKD